MDLRFVLRAASCLLAVLVSGAAFGQATAEKDAVTDLIGNDADNYLGDRIRFAVKVEVRQRKTNVPVCIPPLTRMSVIGKHNSELIVKITDGAVDCDKKSIDTGEAYLLSVTELTQSGLARTGSTYGALIVPFKWHMQGDRDITGSSTVGAYLGYRFETANAIGYTLTPVAFLGGANISVATTDSNGQAKNDNMFGFSAGFGLIGTFKRDFQAGVVIGWDHVSKSAGYQYNGKPWLALEIGFSFMQ